MKYKKYICPKCKEENTIVEPVKELKYSCSNCKCYMRITPMNYDTPIKIFEIGEVVEEKSNFIYYEDYC